MELLVIRRLTVAANLRSNGSFTILLDKLTTLATEYKYDNISFESVLDERFGNFLLKQGFRPTGIEFGITHVKRLKRM